MTTYLEDEKLGPYLKLIDLDLFGQIIRRLRRSKHWTQEKLAAEASLESSYISHIEKGRKRISIPVISNLANAFDVPAVCLTTLCVKDHGLPQAIAQAQQAIQTQMWQLLFPDSESFAAFYNQVIAARSKRKVNSVGIRKGRTPQ
jgi:transcriptional regulator with XRE-family HTH domain